MSCCEHVPLSLNGDDGEPEETPCELFCFENNHWTRYTPVFTYFRHHLADDLAEAGLLCWRPVVYLIRFVDITKPGEPLLFKYVGSTLNVGQRMLQHLDSVWTGDSRKNGSLMMTSVGNQLFRRFRGDLRFFRVEILKYENLSQDIEELHEEERKSMLSERSFAMFGEGGLNIVDPVTYLYVLNGGVSLRHLQQIPFNESWTVTDIINQVFLPRTRERRVSYHRLLETHENPRVRDAYRTVPDFFVASTCNSCLWKDVLHYIQSKSSTSKEVKEGDLRPKYLHDPGDLYVHLPYLAMNLHKDRRPWPFSANSAK